MREMRNLVRAGLRRAEVLTNARAIARVTPERQEVALARAIRRWSAAHYHFVRDPVGVEFLQTPSEQLAQIRTTLKAIGDCDDAAILTAALAMAVGIPCRFYAVSRPGETAFRHVYAVAYPRDRTSGRRVAVELDITRPIEIPALPAFGRRLPLDV